MATALSYVSAVANQSDVPLEKMIAMIATVSSVTRNSAEVIGQAFKSILTRMEAVAAGKSVDEFGEDINNVEKTLREAGIEIRDSPTTFKPMGDVLDEIAGKWETLGTTQQNQIAGAMGGLRQANTLLTLFQNYGDVEKYMAAETQSAGLEVKNYAVYLENAEAAQNRMTSSWEEFWQRGVTSGLISDFYNLVSLALDFTTALGGLRTVLILVVTALLAFKGADMLTSLSTYGKIIPQLIGEFLLWSGAITTTTAAQWGLNVAMDANPIGGIILLVGGAITAFSMLAGVIENVAQEIKDLNTQLEDAKSKFEEAKSGADKMKELSERFEELKATTKRSSEEQKEFLRIQKEIKDILPEVAGSYDEEGNFILAETINAENLTKAINELRDAKLKEMQAKTEEKIEMETELLMKQHKHLSALSTVWNNYGSTVENFVKTLEEANNPLSKIILGLLNLKKQVFELMLRIIDFIPVGEGMTEWYRDWVNVIMGDNPLEGQKSLIEDSIKNWKEAFYSLPTEDLKKEHIQSLRGMGEDWATQLADELEASMSDKVTPAMEAGSKEAGQAGVDVLSEEYQKLVDVVMDMIKQKKEAEKDALQDQLNNIKDEIDAQKEYYKIQMEEVKRVSSEKKKAAQRELAEIKRNFEAQQDAIKSQLEAYEKIIDAQKKSLDLQKREADYNREKEEKQSNLSDLEARIAALMFDTSEAGIAERLRLEEEAAKLRAEIAQDEADRAYELQVDALDAELEMAQQEADIQLSQIEAAQQQAELEYELLMNRLEDEEYAAERSYEIYTANLDAQYDAQEALLESQIQAIDDYLEQEGTIRRDAMDMIADENSNLYQELLDWNKAYGSGIDEDIINMWNTAIGKVEEYAQALSEIPDAPDTPTGNPALDDWWNDVPTSSDSSSTTSNPALDDWWNDGQSSQINAIMQRNAPPTMGATPQTTSTSIGNSASVGNLMNFNVSGNLDSSVIPSIEKIANEVMNKINNINLMRGNKRSSVLFSG